MPRRSHPAWRRRHEAVLMWCLQNPARKLQDCAAETGYSRGQVSRIVNSPDFKRRYREVRKRIEKVLSRAVVERFHKPTGPPEALNE